jgi:hypothetical protein
LAEFLPARLVSLEEESKGSANIVCRLGGAVLRSRADWSNQSGRGKPVYFCDPGWTNFGWRFYRARLK